MKKLFYVILIILCSSAIQAQFVKNLGVKFGATISSLEWESKSGLGISFDPDSKISFSGGIFAEFFDLKVLSLITELNYYEKGAEEEYPITNINNPEGTGETYKWNASLKYFDISLMVKARLEVGEIQPYLLLGPCVDIQLDKSSELESIQNEKTMIGLKSGLGVEFSSLLPFKFLLEVVYQMDLNKFYSNENLDISSRAIDLRVGIIL